MASRVEVLNLSLSGVAIRADRRLNIGSEYRLKLEAGDHFLSVKGVVVWSVLSGIRRLESDEVPLYSAGMKFVDVLTDKLQDLIDFIDDHKISEEHRLGGIRFQINAPGRAVLDTVESYRVRLISLSGMLIEADRTFEVERVHPMQFQPPGGDPVSFAGRIASCLEAPDDGPRRFRIGVAFADMADSDRRRLEAFVASLDGR